MKKTSALLSVMILFSGVLFADDKAEVIDVIKSHWKYNNDKDWKNFVATLHSEGTRNGDSNGSFWYVLESTVKAVRQGISPNDETDFIPRYIEVDVLEKGKVAVAYYYLVGSYKIDGVSNNNYRTRVSQIFLKEKGNWKVKSGHFSPFHSGSGIPE